MKKLSKLLLLIISISSIPIFSPNDVLAYIPTVAPQPGNIAANNYTFPITVKADANQVQSNGTIDDTKGDVGTISFQVQNIPINKNWSSGCQNTSIGNINCNGKNYSLIIHIIDNSDKSSNSGNGVDTTILTYSFDTNGDCNSESSSVNSGVWTSEGCDAANSSAQEWIGDLNPGDLFNNYKYTKHNFTFSAYITTSSPANNNCNSSGNEVCVDGNLYKPISTVNTFSFSVTPPKYTGCTANFFDHSSMQVSPSQDAIPGRTVSISFDNALNTPQGSNGCNYANPNSANSVEYHFGVEENGNNNAGLTVDSCKSNQCNLIYTLPSLSDLNGAGSVTIILVGPSQEDSSNNNTSNYDIGTDANVMTRTITLDTAWATIITNDPDGSKEQRCNYETPPRTCPFVQNPIYNGNPRSGSEYEIDPNVHATDDQNDILQCHTGNDEDFICANQNQIACNTNPQQAPSRSSIRCIDRNAALENNPCLHTAIDKQTGEVYCADVQTALGEFPTDPQQLVTKVFGVLLSLAGGIALLLIIMSGYRMMASQGNPEALQGAREQLTSAIVGLLFIIFSMAVFEIITHGLLNIPGFQ